MHYVDLERWKRKATFDYFKDFEDPFFNLTANVDATAVYRFSKENGLSFALMSVFCSLRAANGIREFRLRFDGERVAEFASSTRPKPFSTTTTRSRFVTLKTSLTPTSSTARARNQSINTSG